jgi:hypothetical protein
MDERNKLPRSFALPPIPRRALSIMTVIVAFSLSCSDPGEEVKDELMDEIASASTVFHFGCDMNGRCSSPDRMCVTEQAPILDHFSTNGSAAIEWEAPFFAGMGSREYYWFVDSNGGGRRYFVVGTDVELESCNPHCGWNVEMMPAGSIISLPSTINLEVRGQVITSFGSCRYPPRASPSPHVARGVVVSVRPRPRPSSETSPLDH